MGFGQNDRYLIRAAQFRDYPIRPVLLGSIGYTWVLDIAYRYIVGSDRDIDHSINSPPGEYSDQTHTIVITATINL